MHRRKLLIRSGSQHTHFVHLDYADYWLIRSYKNPSIYIDGKDDPDDPDAIPVVINRNTSDEFEKANAKCVFVLRVVRILLGLPLF